MGITVKGDSFPGRGERVAQFVEAQMRLTGVQVNELAFRVRADSRDLRRLLNDRSCGSRLEDCLAAYFGWLFVEEVMTPVIGADPITARERELEARRAQAAAIHARLERDRAVRRELDRAAELARPCVGVSDRTETDGAVA